MKTISCHSNHSSYQIRIKIITFVEGNVQIASMPIFSFILLTVSEKKNFEYFFCENLRFISPRQPIKLSYLDKSLCNMEDYSINISVKKKSNISSKTAETVNFQFSHYKSMGTIYKLP